MEENKQPKQAQILKEYIEQLQSEAFEKGFKTAIEQGQRHGHWIGNGSHICHCSVCGQGSLWPFGNYCKWCGAKMDEEVKDE